MLCLCQNFKFRYFFLYIYINAKILSNTILTSGKFSRLQSAGLVLLTIVISFFGVVGSKGFIVFRVCNK